MNVIRQIAFGALVVLSGMRGIAAFPFEQCKYYYATDSEGAYSFEFKDGDFQMYRPKGFPDAPGPDKVEIPDSPGFYAEMIHGKYRLQETGGMVLLVVGADRFLVLFKEDIVVMLVDASGIKRQQDFFIGFRDKYCAKAVFMRPPLYSTESKTDVEVSSNLEGGTKSGISYQPPFGKYHLSNEWVVGKANGGIGEWMEISNSYGPAFLMINNGFIYPPDPNYFGKNNRIRRIRVDTADNGSYSKEFELLDTANPQFVPVKSSRGSSIKLTILDIYKGTDFNDTALGFLAFVVNPTEALSTRLNAMK